MLHQLWQKSFALSVCHRTKERLSASTQGRNSPSSNIVYHYDHTSDGKNIYGRPFSPSTVLRNGKPEAKRPEMKKPEVKKSLFSKESSHLTRKASKASRDVYEFEKKVPMHRSSLEAQKFKTIIFLSGH